MEIEIENSWKELITSFISFHPTYHIVFEVLLLVGGLCLFFSRSYKPRETIKLTRKEEEELINEWEPQTLVPDKWKPDPRIQSIFERAVVSVMGKYVLFEGHENKPKLNMSGTNFFDLIGDERITENAVSALKKYGVGSCGPRGFYGTFDVHLNLEDELATFMECEEAVVYSYGFSTVASAIPAYSKRGDVVFVDEGVSFAVQCGLVASRSKVRYFCHNDVNHLRSLLEEYSVECAGNTAKAKVTRTFIVIEGLYLNYGDICPLPEIVKLKYEFKVRIFLDETISFGVLGRTGRGVTEHLGVDVSDIDLITGSLETSLATCGGFSVGSKYVVDHQRLSGQGYCFSASLPPLLACGASIALGVIKSEEGMERRQRLTELSLMVDKRFNNELSTFWKMDGDTNSPVKHIRLTVDNNNDRLEKAVDLAFEEGVLLTVARYLTEGEHKCPQPSIRLSLNCALTDDEVDTVVNVFKSIGDALIIQTC